MQITRSLKQQLFRGHVFMGIWLSLFMYVSVFFGLFGIFMHYIQAWEKPSRHFPTLPLEEIVFEPMLESVLSDPDFPRDRIAVSLPGFKKDPALRISHQFTAETVFNPATGEKIMDEGRTSNLAMFLNGMHYARPLKLPGLMFFGFLTQGFLFLLAGGLVLVLVIKYKDRGKTRQTLFSKWHRKIFIWTCTPLVPILICASVMGVSLHHLDPMARILTRGESGLKPLVGPVLFPEPQRISPENRAVPMQPISVLLEKARQMAPGLDFQRLILENWGDETAQIKLEGVDPKKPFVNGLMIKPAIVLRGKDGNVLKQHKISDRPWAVMLAEAVYYLHFLFGAHMVLRLLVFGFMVATGLGLGFGVLLWMEKKQRRFKGEAPFYHWMPKLSLAVMLGVIPATGLFITLQWVLPFDLPHRLTWHQGMFFNAWLASLAWSFFRVSGVRAAKDFLMSGGFLFLAAPLLHWFYTGLGPLALVRTQMTPILWVDLSLALAGFLFLLAGARLPGIWKPNSTRQIQE